MAYSKIFSYIPDISLILEQICLKSYEMKIFHRFFQKKVKRAIKLLQKDFLD